MFPFLPWRDRESVKPRLSEEKVNEWCGICMGWQGKQGQVESWKRCEKPVREGRALELPAAPCRGTSPKAPENSLSAGGSLMVAAAASPLDFCCLQVVWHQQTLLVSGITSVLILRRDQHCFVLDDDEPSKTLCATWLLSWGLPAGISAEGGSCCVKSDLGRGFEEESNF